MHSSADVDMAPVGKRSNSGDLSAPPLDDETGAEHVQTIPERARGATSSGDAGRPAAAARACVVHIMVTSMLGAVRSGARRTSVLPTRPAQAEPAAAARVTGELDVEDTREDSATRPLPPGWERLMSKEGALQNVRAPSGTADVSVQGCPILRTQPQGSLRGRCPRPDVPRCNTIPRNQSGLGLSNGSGHMAPQEQ